MEDSVFDALRSAITMARQFGIKSTSRLKIHLKQRGFDEPTINAALLFWAKHVR
jgi:hypothetical protein